MTQETAENRLKRLTMRSWRRGIKEMDMVLGPFAERHLGDLSQDELQAYDRLLSENDHDLYAWISGRIAPPAEHAPLLARIAEFAGIEI